MAAFRNGGRTPLVGPILFHPHIESDQIRYSFLIIGLTKGFQLLKISMTMILLQENWLINPGWIVGLYTSYQASVCQATWTNAMIII